MDNEKYHISFEAFLKTVKKHISILNLKNSIQKDYILKVLYYSNKHLSAEEISFELKKNYQMDIGVSTIYRTMNFFEELNIVNTLDIKNSAKKYELSLTMHHDHLICTSCHNIIEFVDEQIEEKQIEIAKENNFRLTNHIMVLYGVCSTCQNHNS